MNIRKAALLFGAAMLHAFTLSAQSVQGAFSTPQINREYYVGQVPGFYPTVQSAVTATCAISSGPGSLGSRVVVSAGSPADGASGYTIPAVTGGCTKVSIIDQRAQPATTCSWGGSSYSCSGGGGGGATIAHTNNVIKGDGTGNGLAATPGTDYVVPSGSIGGTAAGLSGTPALPNGTTATTQTVGDNSTKVATDAFVLANAGTGSGGLTGQTPGYAVEAATATTATGPFPMDDSVTTANTVTVHKALAVNDGTGHGGGFNGTEGTAPTGASGIDNIWADSTSHRLKMNNNAGGAVTVASLSDIPPVQISTNIVTRYALNDGSGAPKDSSGNGNNATLPGGGANPVWTPQGISCDGASQYFNSVGTRTNKTFVWATTETLPLNNGFPISPQFVTAFGTVDIAILIGSNQYYGNNPGVGLSGTFSNQSSDTFQGTHVWTLVLGTNTSTDPDRLYKDGVQTTYAPGAIRSASVGVATADYGVCGTPSGFGTFFPGNMYYWESYSDQKGASDIQIETNAVKTLLTARGVIFNKAPDPNPINIYMSVGDSLTNGEGVTPSSASITPTDTFNVVNYGLGNAGTSDLNALFEARDSILFRPNASRNVLRLWIGTNDVSTMSGTNTTALAGINAYCNKARKAGFTTIFSTAIDRLSLSSTIQSLNAVTLANNTCDLTLDLAANPLLGATGANSSATNFQSDHIHLTNAGQLIVAAAETRAINLLSYIKNRQPIPIVTASTYTMSDHDLWLMVDSTSSAIAVTLPDCTYFTGLQYSVKISPLLPFLP
jgi:hypothetical protein